MTTIRSRRDFIRRYFPKRYRREYIQGTPPASCVRCGVLAVWRRAPIAWLCKECGTFAWDDARDPAVVSPGSHPTPEEGR